MSKGLRKNTATAEDTEGEVRSHSSVHPSEQGTDFMAIIRAMHEEQRKTDLLRMEAEARRDVIRKEEDARKELIRKEEEVRTELIRKEEEARKDEKREEERRKEMIALEARLLAQQNAREDRQHEQQLALMREQANIGDKHSRLYKEGQEEVRKKETALRSISVFNDGDDLEEFFLTTERRLSAADIRQGEWVTIIDSKLKGKMACAWQDINMSADGYLEAKDRLLRMCGYTPMLAADIYHGFKAENCCGLTADQLYQRGQQLLRRMMAPERVADKVEFALLKGWISTVVPKKARAALEARSVSNVTELAGALQDYLVLERGRTEGQAAVFRKEYGESGRDRGPGFSCFNCGKVGHKAVDCWERKGGPSLAKPEAAEVDSGVVKLVCYTCNQESPDCPSKPRNFKSEPSWNKHIKAEPKEVQSLRRIKITKHQDTFLSMRINSQEAMVLLDSGSSVTVVPETMVAQAQKTGDTVAVRGFGAKKHMLLPMAEIPFVAGPLSWIESVALAPVEEGVPSEVVFGLNLKSKRGMDLILLANDVELPEALPEQVEIESQKVHVVGSVQLGSQSIAPIAEEGQLNLLKTLSSQKARVVEKVPLAAELEFSVDFDDPISIRKLKLLSQAEVDMAAEEEVFKPLNVRRLIVVDKDDTDSHRKYPSVVGGARGRLGASFRPVVRSNNFYFNVVSSAKQHHDLRKRRRQNRRPRGTSSMKRRESLPRSSQWSRYQDATEGGCCYQKLGEMWGQNPTEKKILEEGRAYELSR